jgi:hypothetical protein
MTYASTLCCRSTLILEYLSELVDVDPLCSFYNCSYADSVLIPALVKHGRFIDQE